LSHDPGLRLADDDGPVVETGWDAVPRWLRYTGLPQVLGMSPMSTLELLLRRSLSYRTRERPAMDRDGQLYPPGTVPYTYGELARQLGGSQKTVERGLKILREYHLLDVVEPGYKLRDGTRAPSWGMIDLDLLEHVYVLTCSEIPVEAGGLMIRGRPGEAVHVRLFQATAPIVIRRHLGADDQWEPPYELVKALCRAPRAFEDIMQHKRATLKLRDDCAALQREYQETGRADVSGLRDRLANLLWAPDALAVIVENTVESVGK